MAAGRGGRAVGHGGAWGGWHGRPGPGASGWSSGGTWGVWYGMGWRGWYPGGGFYGCCGWGVAFFYDPFWDPYLWYGEGPVDLPYGDFELPSAFESMPPAATDWYYCPDSRSYYPEVDHCASEWQKVPATQ
ncbi:MAG TPA: hypothetical protein VED47_00295 [Burkholderiaceae bacterium]|nr:hypothetical protein [Burkholderiaceae bacterium]